jgi:signal transduction histidine kinase
MASNAHMSWVPAAALTSSWLPAHFEPRFLEMEDALRAEPGRYVRLGDVAGMVSMWPPKDVIVSWIVRRRGEQLTLEQASDDVSQFVVLPDECLVLHPLVFNGQMATMYWAASVAGGSGATTSTCYALVSRTGVDIAWLEQALKTELVRAQLERASVGGPVPLLRHEDLADVRVPILPFEDQVRAAQRARHELVQDRNRILHGEQASPKQHVLTGATHEDRVEQFERLLFEEGFAVPGGAFHVEAIAHQQDDWMVRRVGEGGSSQGVSAERMIVDSTTASDWRTWYFDQSATSPFRVFNALGGGPELPSSFLLPIAAAAAVEMGRFIERALPPGQELRLPTFADFAAAVESGRENGELDLDLAMAEVGRLWDVSNPGFPLSEDAFAWLRRVFRPVLCIAVLRAGKPAGAFILQGPDQLEQPFDVLGLLEAHGQQLAAILAQPSEIAEDAARRESIRRLSWMMHQLNGPMMVMRVVIDELVDFVAAHSELGETLLPDESRARARAQMNAKPIEKYRLAHRLAELAEAAQGIRRMQYQIRSYKNAQGELQLTTFPIRPLLEELAAEARGQLQEALVQVITGEDQWVSADRTLLRAALSEVVSNACRECRERKATEPCVTLSAECRGSRMQIAVVDNGLPIDVTLLDDPFAEDASTYRSVGKGSGLGLAIVKESFARHGGRCALYPNRTVDGERIPGVLFTSDVVAAKSPSSPPGVPNV